jgi:Asp-tRNA(Asn)/Glu-tRNA(Gln) amidotransferase A subunit family amidase
MQDTTGMVWPRRGVLKLLSLMGAGAVFSRALVTLADDGSVVTEEMIRNAEWVSGVQFSDEERKLMREGVNELVASYTRLREVELGNDVPPALVFQPAADRRSGGETTIRGATPSKSAAGERPASDTDLAFLPVTELSALVRTRKVSSMALTRLYLDRLKRHDPELQCVISLTEELALHQAAQADREIAAGHYRGPLHGIPWGAKDLLAVDGYRTTWGARPYESQMIEQTASVVSRLNEAGAVLVAKLTLGALAWGDVWYGGETKNPWNLEQGSSGSSAGPAAATAAGLVAFALGSETWGSIVSPCTRCGVTGLRPTFGSVSRHGAMALSWSMDKIGPIARSVEDCALIFDAIRGTDGLDPSVIDRPFSWPLNGDVRTLRVGYIPELFEVETGADIEDEADRVRARERNEFDRRTLETLRGLGFKLVPMDLPASYPVDDLSFILTAEAATAFDGLTRSGKDDTLVRQVTNAWPNVFRQGQTIPAVEYIRANRIRSLVIAEMEQKLADVDLYVCPSFGGNNLLLTNLTGHPCVVLPNGFYTADNTPASITVCGTLNGETELLAVAHAYQQVTDFHLKRPATGS